MQKTEVTSETRLTVNVSVYAPLHAPSYKSNRLADNFKNVPFTNRFSDVPLLSFLLFHSSPSMCLYAFHNSLVGRNVPGEPFPLSSLQINSLKAIGRVHKITYSLQ